MGGGDQHKLFDFTVGKQLRSNYALVPLVLIGAFGLSLSAFQIVRTLTKSPDVSINRRGNPKPYQNYEKDGDFVQYKYYSTLDYKNLKADPDRPKLD